MRPVSFQTDRQEYSIDRSDGTHIPKLGLEANDALCLRLLLTHLGQQLRDVRNNLHTGKGKGTGTQ